MTVRRFMPYLLVAAMFAFIYWLTMTVTNSVLFLGYGAGSKAVMGNNKIQLHLYLFNYGLAIAIVFVNFWEIITTTRNMLWLRLAKSILTIASVYVITYFIFLTLDTRVMNMHYYPRGAPAKLWCVVTIILTVLGISLIEI